MMTHKRNHTKAQLFTIDALLALIIIAGSLGAATMMVRHTAGTHLVALESAGADVVTRLDHAGVLQDVDDDALAAGIASTLPVRYQMQTNITCDDGSDAVAGPSVPVEGTVIGGTRFFITSDHGPCIATWRVWPR